MPLFLSDPPPLWVPPRPAIIRSAKDLAPPLALGSVLPGIGAAAGHLLAPLRTLTEIDYNTSNTTSLSLGTIQAGDVALVFDFPYTVASPAVPSGYTAILTQSGSDGFNTFLHYIYYRILTGAETTVSVNNGDTQDHSAVIIVRGNRPIMGVNVPAANFQHTTGNPTAQTVTVAGNQRPMMVWAAYSGDSSIITPTNSPTMDLDDINSGFRQVGRLYYGANDTPADQSWDTGDTGTFTQLSSGLISFF